MSSESPKDKFESGIESFEPLTEDEQAVRSSKIRKLLKDGNWSNVEFLHRDEDYIVTFDFDDKRGIYSYLLVHRDKNHPESHILIEATGPRMAVYARTVGTGKTRESLIEEPGRVRKGDIHEFDEFFEYPERFELIDSNPT